MNKMYLPNYENSILSIVISILKHYKIALPINHSFKEEIKIPDDKNIIILMVFDGMGSNVMDLLDNNSFFKRNKLTDLSSVYPCTTAAATRSFYSALEPISHGYLGWNCYFKECGRNIAVLKNKDFFTGETIDYASKILKYTSIFELIKNKWGNEVKIHHLMPQFVNNGFSSLDKVEEAIVSICADNGKHFIFFYWDLPDTLIHLYGPYSKEAVSCITNIDTFVGRVATLVKNTSLFITADHGMKQINKCVSLNDSKELVDCLYLPPALEYRAMSLFVKPHRIDRFVDIFLNNFGDEYSLLCREEVFKQHLFGFGHQHIKVDDFVGDYLACATGDALLHYISPINSKSIIYKGHHSGLTKEELIVPLIYFES